MKDIKPIKRHSAIAELSRDHHSGLLLVWKIREGIKKSTEPNRIKLYIIHSFDSELEPHFKEEEELLFSKIAKENKLRLEAETDHTTIRQLINTIRIDTLSSYDLFEKFAECLEKHIRFEERILFNFIQESFSESDLSQIAHALSEKKQEQNIAPWQDAFWERRS
jgi:iron-sulfur cluster repair protein YtfE (RIC family)